jgi:hypothetical protein
MDILLGLSSLSRVLVGFGEGVYACHSQRLHRESKMDREGFVLHVAAQRALVPSRRLHEYASNILSMIPLQSHKKKNSGECCRWDRHTAALEILDLDFA